MPQAKVRQIPFLGLIYAVLIVRYDLEMLYTGREIGLNRSETHG